MKVTRYYICVKGDRRQVTKDDRWAEELMRRGWSMTFEDFYG